MRYLIANWKMKLTVEESVALARAAREEIIRAPLAGLELSLCPSFPALPAVGDVLKGSGIELGAQDAASVDRASLTGAVSLLQLRELGVAMCIVGHSERRAHFGETDAVVHEKVKHALRAGMRTVLCVGEKAEERASGNASAHIRRQLQAAIEGIEDISRLMIAYEPVWAIGTGVPVSVQDAAGQAEQLKAELAEMGYGQGVIQAVPILYGGSVDKATVIDFTRSPLSGTLVGNASQTADGLLGMVSALRANTA